MQPPTVKRSSDLDLRDPTFVRAWVRYIGDPLLRYFRGRASGFERIPDGPVLFVGNHSGGKSLGDAVFMVRYTHHFGCDAPIYALVHRAFARVAAVRENFARLGLVCATREHAEDALSRGDRVVVYPGADHDAFRPFARRDQVDLGGRRGFIRLAARSQVPIVPVVTAGSHETFVVLAQGKRLANKIGMPRIFGLHTFPLVLCAPYGLLVGPACLMPHFPLPARIEVDVGQPIAVDPTLADADRDDPAMRTAYEQIETTMTSMLGELYAKRRFPIVG